MSPLQSLIDAGINLAGVALKNLLLVFVVQAGGFVDVPLCVVEVLLCFGIDSSHRANHLRSKNDVVSRNNLEEQIDSGLMVHARVEEDIVSDQIGQQRPLHILGKPTIAAPMVGYSSATMRNNESQRGKIFEKIRCDELHEGGGICVDVMSAGRMEIGIAGGADVNHRRDVKLDHFFVERIPIFVGQRRSRPMPAGRIGIKVAANKTKFFDAPLEFSDGVTWRYTRSLG
jgi:hypothetical protein